MAIPTDNRRDNGREYSRVFGLYEGISKILSAKKNVVIEYGEILKIELPPPTAFYNTMYLLRIKKTKGQSIAKSVKGYITIEGTDVQNIPLQWYREKSSSNSVNDFKDLRIIAAQWVAVSDLPYLSIPHSSDTLPDQFIGVKTKDVMNKRVTVRIESENAIAPNQPFIDTVENIISNARDMKS